MQPDTLDVLHAAREQQLRLAQQRHRLDISQISGVGHDLWMASLAQTKEKSNPFFAQTRPAHRITRRPSASRHTNRALVRKFRLCMALTIAVVGVIAFAILR